MSEDRMLMAKVADLYYLRDLTQQEIADRLGFSRPTVSRLLRRSRAAGVVRIEVIAPDGLQHRLARELEQTFHLREAVVFPGAETLRLRPGAPSAWRQRTISTGSSRVRNASASHGEQPSVRSSITCVRGAWERRWCPWLAGSAKWPQASMRTI